MRSEFGAYFPFKFLDFRRAVSAGAMPEQRRHTLQIKT
jgi:hypothetical protein